MFKSKLLQSFLGTIPCKFLSNLGYPGHTETPLQSVCIKAHWYSGLCIASLTLLPPNYSI